MARREAAGGGGFVDEWILGLVVAVVEGPTSVGG